VSEITGEASRTRPCASHAWASAARSHFEVILDLADQHAPLGRAALELLYSAHERPGRPRSERQRRLRRRRIEPEAAGKRSKARPGRFADQCASVGPNAAGDDQHALGFGCAVYGRRT